MKKFCIAVLILLASTGPLMAQSSVRVVNNNAFGYGEKISYTIKYNLYFNMDVGQVDFTIDDKPEVVAGNNCFHITGKGKTFSFYDHFYKVRDNYETYLECNSLLPLLFIRNVNEGKFSFDEYVLFNHNLGIAKSKKKTKHVPKLTEDVLSSIYLARTFDYANAKLGQSYTMNTYIDDSAYKVGVKYVGKEVLKTSLGKVSCIKLKPILIVDRLFKSQDDMTLWVTDDENHIPVRIESGISVGKIVADLSSYSGLKNPMTALK